MTAIIWSWPGWGGGGGEGVHSRAGGPGGEHPPPALAEVKGEQGGVGSLGFLALVDLLVIVFRSGSTFNSREIMSYL